MQGLEHAAKDSTTQLHPTPPAFPKQLQGCSIVCSAACLTPELQEQEKLLQILISESPPPRSTLVCLAGVLYRLNHIHWETETHALGKDSCTPSVGVCLKSVEPILVFKGYLWVSSVRILKINKWQANKRSRESWKLKAGQKRLKHRRGWKV